MKTQPSEESTQPRSGALPAPLAGMRWHFAPWFEVAGAFNELGMRVLTAVKPELTNHQQVFAAALYSRILTSFQAAHLLAEHGMLADTRTLVRAGAETTIVLCAVIRDAKIIDSLRQSHLAHHRKMRKAWLNGAQTRAAMTEEDVARVEADIARIDADDPAIAGMQDPVYYANLAQKAGVTSLYDVVYRVTSGDAAHATLDALTRHVTEDERGNLTGLKFGPETGDLAATLLLAMTVLVAALGAVLALFQLPQFNDELRRCQALRAALPVAA